jgi:hypothetical protein
VGQLFIEIEKEKVMNSNTTALHHVVICQRWEESERGWGTRPDGTTLHLSEEDLCRFIKNYWDSMPDRINGKAPDIYSRPDGDAFPVLVNDILWSDIVNSKKPYGYWIQDNDMKRGEIRRVTALELQKLHLITPKKE